MMAAPLRTPSQWWQDPRLLWSWELKGTREEVAETLSADSLIVVSDGSKKETHGTSAFTVARRGSNSFLITGDAIVFGPKEKMAPYRAELFGIISAMAW